MAAGRDHLARCPKCGKVMYRESQYKLAEHHAWRMRNRHGELFRVYYSKRCGCFHVGRDLKKVKE